MTEMLKKYWQAITLGGVVFLTSCGALAWVIVCGMSGRSEEILTPALWGAAGPCLYIILCLPYIVWRELFKSIGTVLCAIVGGVLGGALLGAFLGTFFDFSPSTVPASDFEILGHSLRFWSYRLALSTAACFGWFCGLYELLVGNLRRPGEGFIRAFLGAFYVPLVILFGIPLALTAIFASIPFLILYVIIVEDILPRFKTSTKESGNNLHASAEISRHDHDPR